MSAAARVSALDIAAALGEVRGTPVPAPTDEQRAVIEAPLAPALVVAGAGSGKTETMANRVLWLLANGFVAPTEVLGLTFTRKAAGELGARIRERIAELEAAGLLPERDPLDAPTVATYNAFANGLARDFAVLVGREGDAPVLGEAAAWQLARGVVTRSRDARLADLEKGVDQIVPAVLQIARGVAENDVDLDAVRRLGADLARLGDLPTDRYPREGVADLAATLGTLPVLADLAAEFEAEKERRGVVEYSDQVALALRIARQTPTVAADLRDRYRVVLLDEYQDTSVVQTRLLAELFAGHPVMAVGDPNQAIYGWRGASSSNLEEFATVFGAAGSRFALSTSWRNGTAILDAANAVVAPLAGRGVAVDRLAASPVASTHPVEALFAETLDEEADAVADWLAARVGPQTSAAVLLRTRAAQGPIVAALRDRGIPVHVLGVGGLLAEPEIADLVCALAVLDDPGAGIQLLRLLAGSRWSIGVADLRALARLASWLRERDVAQRRLDDATRELLRAAAGSGEGGSIVDALDFLATAPDGHAAVAGFSEPGLARLRDAGATFARLRARARLDLPDLVALVTQELRLDLEVAANDARVAGAANLRALDDAVAGYLAIAEAASLRGFLAWLREAEQREDLSPRPEPPEPGTVQVLTVHGAKGLEWDVVAVPRLVAGEFPATPREGFQGWLAFGRFPWELRGDARDLPVFAWRSAATRKDVVDAQKAFSTAVRERALAEERRLAYVAVTRARHRLLLSGAFWATQIAPREPSPFLRELADAGLVPAIPSASEFADNPRAGAGERFSWPVDPLGSRRAAVEWAAGQVREAEPRLEGPWAREAQLLLAERAARAAGEATPLPVRIPASRFHDLVADPERVALDLRRPMPERPFSATRLGTLFHAWVERRFGVGGGVDELDATDAERDLGSGWGGDLADLRARFDASAWAARAPIEVEREILLPFDDRIVVCKIDAVYAEDDGRVTIVDWKTGRAPRDADDLARKRLQLALYRLAYSRWTGIPMERIDALFVFVAEGREIRPDRLESEEELLARWRAAAPGARVG